MKPWKKQYLKEWWEENKEEYSLGNRGDVEKTRLELIVKELDGCRIEIQVAEEIFGYPVKVNNVWYYTDLFDYERPVIQMRTKIFDDGSGESWEDLPRYTEDLNEAFKLLNDNMLVEISKYSDYWKVDINGWSFMGKRLAETICRSVLEYYD